MDSYGFLSLIPPLLAIGLAWWTKNVLISLFVGIFSGAFILNDYNLLIAFLRTLDKDIIEALANNWNALYSHWEGW
jgi:Na+/H+ antiporter NhaC